KNRTANSKSKLTRFLARIGARSTKFWMIQRAACVFRTQGRFIMNRQLFVLVLMLAGCKQEQRVLVNQPPWVETRKSRYEVDVAPNGESARVKTWWGENAWSMSEGKRLYESYNCVGCHAHGGAGMGPAFMDEKWIYGSEPYQVYGWIGYGRPYG